jgi:surface protein
MFKGAVFNGDLSHWNVSQVTTMTMMFYLASAFNQDLSAWDVSKVTNMASMFNTASAFNQDLSAWDVGQVTTMFSMFYQASAFNFALCGQAWRDSTVDQYNMFDYSGGGSIPSSACVCPYNLCLDETHSTGGVCSAGTCTCPAPFSGDRCEKIECPPGQEKVGIMCVACPDGEMSSYDSTCGASCAGSLTQVGKKCVFQPADRAALDAAVAACLLEDNTGACPSYEPIGHWDVSQVTDAGAGPVGTAFTAGVFQSKGYFNQDLNGWDVSQVTNMQNMFSGAGDFNGDISRWDVSQVTNMWGMLSSTNAFNVDISGWDVSKVTKMGEMFGYNYVFNQDISAWDVGKVTNMYGMFRSTLAFNHVLCGNAWVNGALSGTVNTNNMFQSASGGSIAGSVNSCAGSCPYNLCRENTHDTEGVCSNYQCTCPYPLGGERCEIACKPGEGRVDGVCVECPTDQMSSYDSTCGASCAGSLTQVGKKCVFQPANNAALTAAVNTCINQDATGACPSYEPITLWDVSRVTDMTEVFKDKTQFNQDLNEWDVSQVTTMYFMFRFASAFNGDISAWDVSQLTDMYQMFKGASAFNGDLSLWDVSKVTTMTATFNSASVFNQDLSAWDVGRVTNMQYMFFSAPTFNQDLSAWDVSSVTIMGNMFNSASAFNQVLCGQAWVDSNADQTSMFINAGGGSIAGSACACPYNLCREETHPTGGSCSAGTCTCTAPFGGGRCYLLCPPGEQAVGQACVACPDGQMSSYDSTCGASCAGSLTQVGKKCVFQMADKAALQTAVDACIAEDSSGACPSYEPIRYWDVSQVTDMEDLFYNKYDFNQPLNDWNVSQVTDMSRMFFYCAYFNQPLPDWDTGKVTDMYYMFGKAWRFNEDVDNWNTANVEYMHGMFYGGGSDGARKPAGGAEFNRDISRWNVHKVLNIGYMFQQQSNMQKDLSRWSVRSDVSVDAGTFDLYTTELCGIAWSQVVDNDVNSKRCATPPDETICVAAGLQLCPHDPVTGEGGTCRACTDCVDKPHTTLPGMCRPCPAGEEQDGNVCVVCPDGEMSAYDSACGGSCPSLHKLVGKACIPLCPPGHQHVYGACVVCPDGEMSAYDSACGASCSGDLTQMHKRCVYTPTTQDIELAKGFESKCAPVQVDLRGAGTQGGTSHTDCGLIETEAECNSMTSADLSGSAGTAQKCEWMSDQDTTGACWLKPHGQDGCDMFRQGRDAYNILEPFRDGTPGDYMIAVPTREVCEAMNDAVAVTYIGGTGPSQYDYNLGAAGGSDCLRWVPPEGRCDIRKVGDGSCNTNKNYINCGLKLEADCKSFGNDCCIWIQTADSVAKEQGVCVWKVGFNNQLDGVCAQTQAHAQYSLETILIGQSGLFADLPNGPESSKLLSQCTGGNTVCLGEYGCEHTTSGVLGGGYGDAQGDCMVWENERSCGGLYFCPNHGCVSTCEDCCAYPVNGTDAVCVATCQEGYSVQDGKCTECATGFTRAAGDDPTAGNTVCWKYLANVNGKDFYEFDGSNKGSQNMCAAIDSDFVSPTLYSECLSAKALNTGLSEDYHNPMTVPDTTKSGTAANWMNKKPYPCVVQDENFVINLEGATSCTECTGLAHHSINPICVKAPMDRTGLFQALQDCVGCCQRACSAVSPLDTASGIDAGTLGSAECDAANAFCDAADGMHNDWTDGDGASCGALDTSEVRSLHYLFYRAETMNVNISGWDVSKVTNGRSTFFRAASFNQDISSWSTSNFLTMRSMFHKASSFNQPLSVWDVTSVVDMQDMFRDASAFNQDISLWKVTRVTNMQGMFYGATAFNQDLSGWNVAKVTDMTYMFASATALNYDLSAWSVGNVNSLDNVFHNAGYGFTLCGDAWVNLNVSDTDFGATISGPCVDSCPYNYCMNNTHLTGGVCAAGVCTCPIPLEGDRCDLRCPGKRFRIANGCDECVPGYAKTGGTCRNASVSESDFLATFKAGKVKAERAKAVRGMVRPMRDTKKTLKENVVSVPMETADLTDEQVTLIQEMETTFGGTLELKMSVAAEQTAPLENPSAAECTFDIKDQETGKKTVLQAYGVDNYVYICDTTSGTIDFVAEVKETETGSDVRCRNESVWDAAVSKNPGETEICKGVPVLVGSATLACGPDGGCCTDAECERGDCINSVCVCEPLYEGNRCHIPKLCEDIKEADLYQKKGCCDC